MNIYVPDDLRRRMKAIAESVNWSAVACEGFEAKLGELAEARARQREAAMGEVVERLRASKRKTEDEDYRHGHAAGVDWAKQQAEAVELERLEEAGEAFKANAGVGSSVYTSAEQLAGIIAGDHAFESIDRDEAGEFWERLAGEQEPADSYLVGFVDGALEVWGAVKGEL